jgi:hypothetical protein
VSTLHAWGRALQGKTFIEVEAGNNAGSNGVEIKAGNNDFEIEVDKND